MANVGGGLNPFIKACCQCYYKVQKKWLTLDGFCFPSTCWPMADKELALAHLIKCLSDDKPDSALWIQLVKYSAFGIAIGHKSLVVV